MLKLFFSPLFIFFLSCNPQTQKFNLVNNTKQIQLIDHTNYDTTTKTIHVFVALCDNKYQGIVPVPPKIGNGQDLNNN